MSDRFSDAPPTSASAALLILRFAAGVIMTAHGFQKLFQIGTGELTGMWAGMGIPLPQITAPFVSVLEFAGGIALILGVLTRIVAALLAIEMVFAIFLVHLPNGLFLPNGYEFALMLFATFTTLAIVGAGAYSLDATVGSRRAALAE